MCDAGSSPTSTVAMPTWPSSATAAATSSRTFAAIGLPSMSVADTRRGYSLLPMRMPRKNDAASIAARREALSLDGAATSVDLTPYLKAAESVTGVAVAPVSVAELRVSVGAYELDENGDVVETGRAEEDVVVPLAHTEGSLTASLQRGARAVAESGGFRTHVLADRITRASCFVCRDVGDAVVLARWIEERVGEMRQWLRASELPELSRHAVLREAKTHVVGPMCHVLWRFTTGDAVGPNMMTRNAYALNMAYVLPNAPVAVERTVLEANMGGDKKPSYEVFQSGHGKTVLAEATLTDAASRRVLRTTAEDLEVLAWVGTQGAVASGMQSVAFTPASALEISASAAMATAGSENFFRAHHERGGLR